MRYNRRDRRRTTNTIQMQLTNTTPNTRITANLQRVPFLVPATKTTPKADYDFVQTFTDCILSPPTPYNNSLIASLARQKLLHTHTHTRMCSLGAIPSYNLVPVPPTPLILNTTTCCHRVSGASIPPFHHHGETQVPCPIYPPRGPN